MTREDIIEILRNAGVILEGHFRLTSGRHSAKYLQCAKIFENTKYSEPLCRELAGKYKDESIDVVIGPALGAIQMAYEVSRHIGVRNIFAERENGSMTLRRNFNIKKGERVLVVEDVITTGGSVREVIDVVEKLGGIVAGIGCVIDRTGGKIDFGYDLKSILSMEVISFEPENCPLCKDNVPIVKPGSR